MHSDETVRRRMDEIAAGLANQDIRGCEGARNRKNNKEYDRMIQQLKTLSQQYGGIVQLIR